MDRAAFTVLLADIEAWEEQFHGVRSARSEQ